MSGSEGGNAEGGKIFLPANEANSREFLVGTPRRRGPQTSGANAALWENTFSHGGAGITEESPAVAQGRRGAGRKTGERKAEGGKIFLPANRGQMDANTWRADRRVGPRFRRERAVMEKYILSRRRGDHGEISRSGAGTQRSGKKNRNTCQRALAGNQATGRLRGRLHKQPEG